MSWQYNTLGDDLSAKLRARAAALEVSQGELLREATDFYLRYVTDDDVLLEARKERLRRALVKLRVKARRLRTRNVCGVCKEPGHNAATCAKREVSG